MRLPLELKVLDPRSPTPDPYPDLDPSAIVVRSATGDEAAAIHTLIEEHLAEGHLLPRQFSEVVVHAHRFVVAVQDDEVLACAELAPLSHSVAEVRSMVVRRDARGCGVGRRIVDELVRRAEAAGFEKLCAFSHTPAYFVHLGFSIVPHEWLREKIVTDCHACSQFRRCGQYAVVRALERPRHACVPLAALHG
ncbi:MAG TPA: GNAT family N-acetyltransferase [Vicinamibacterales bacterium]|jgi:amino-acid N-acetyltransferase|nr:GNAT family N-acetyltransferase [Vicinamibacterales bacterium]